MIGELPKDYKEWNDRNYERKVCVTCGVRFKNNRNGHWICNPCWDRYSSVLPQKEWTPSEERVTYVLDALHNLEAKLALEEAMTKHGK